MQVDGSSGAKFQSVQELIASEKAARAARRGGGGVETSEEEKVRSVRPRGGCVLVCACVDKKCVLGWYIRKGCCCSCMWDVKAL